MDGEKLPLYIVRGFWQAGKTTYIRDFLARDRFHLRGRTLLLVCEEGEEVYDPAQLAALRTELVTLDEPETMTAAHFAALLSEKRPDRVFVEANAMRPLPPESYEPLTRTVSQTLLVDAAALGPQFRNLRQLLSDMLRPAELVIFNRAPDRGALSPYGQAFRLMNGRAGFLWESPLGYHEQAFDPTLPFDPETPELVLTGADYPFWYLDAAARPERYDGRHVTLNAETEPRPELPAGRFFAGRRVMTCCLSDIQFLGFPCAPPPGESLPGRGWLHIRARMHCVKSTPGGAPRLALLAESARPIPPPAEAVLNIRVPG